MSFFLLVQKERLDNVKRGIVMVPKDDAVAIVYQHILALIIGVISSPTFMKTIT
jgi:hypothetical protein